MESLNNDRQETDSSKMCASEHFRAHTLQWRWRRTEGLRFFQKELVEVLKVPGQIPHTNIHSFKERLHPEDAGRAAAALVRIGKDQQRIEFTARFNLLENGYCPFRVSGMITERGSDQQVEEIVGIAQLQKDGLEAGELRRRNERLQRMISSTSAGYWDWNLQTDEEWWSPAMYGLLGYAPNEIRIDYNIWINELVIHEDREHLQAAIGDCLKGQSAYCAEFRMKKKNGTIEWFESRGRIFQDQESGHRHFTGSCINIEAHIQTRVIRERENFLLRETSRIGQIGVWELNLADEIVTWSKEVYNIHGVPQETPIDFEKAVSFYLEEDLSVVSDAVQRAAATGEPFDFEARIRTLDDRVRWVRATGEPIKNIQGLVDRLRGVFQDITRHKEYELNILKANRDLATHNERLTNFSHIVSHNLRTHSGNFEMILRLIEDAEDGEVAGYIDILNKISNSLSETISRLNEITDIQNIDELKLEPLNLAEMVQRAENALLGDIGKADARIETDFGPCESIIANRSYLQSAFQNLLSNAIKYKHPERTPHIRITADASQNHCIIKFEDNGSGIDLKTHGDKIFGLYKVFHRNPDAKGVGLFMTRTQIEAMNGSIEVESEPGEGSIFTIKLPRKS